MNSSSTKPLSDLIGRLTIRRLSLKWMFDEGRSCVLSARVCARFGQENEAADRGTCAIRNDAEIAKYFWRFNGLLSLFGQNN